MNAKKTVVCGLALGLAAGVLAESSVNYVQNGLVAQWDGIENAGRGKHESAPASWTDLVGGLEIRIPEWVTTESNGFYSLSSTETRDVPTLPSISGLGDSVTIEVVAQRVVWRATDNYAVLQSVIRSPYGSFGFRLDTTYGLFTQFPCSASQTKLYTHETRDSNEVDVTGVHTYAARISRWAGASNVLSHDAIAVQSWTEEKNGGYVQDLPSKWIFFSTSRADIRIYAIRVYSRRLSDAEVQSNAEVDRKRFIEGETDGLVRCDLDNVSTNRADIVWALAQTGETSPVKARFTSGFESDLSDGVVRELGTFPRDAVITSAVSFVRRTMTYWRFEVEEADGKVYSSGIDLMPDCAVDSRDYVASGLVAHWDGIENAGRGLHSPTLSAWKDLVGTSDITLPEWVAVSERGLVSTGSMEARTCPELLSIPGLTGDDVTIEVVARRIRWKNTEYGYLQPVLSSPWGSIGYRRNDDDAFYALIPPSKTSGSEPLLYKVRAGNAKATGIQTLSSRITRNSTAAKNDFLINAIAQTLVYDDYSEKNLSDRWKFFANNRTDLEICAIRIYNRRLTDRELSRNTSVDGRRFRVLGEDASSASLIVQYDGSGASCREGYFCWPEPETSHVCEVPRFVQDGAYASTCVGWTLKVETGDDVWTDADHGTDCRMAYRPDGRRHVLVWHTARSRNVPEDYVRLDCLESHGQQLIDTGYTPNAATHAELDIKFAGDFNTTQNVVFGAPVGSDGLAFHVNYGTLETQATALFFWTRYSYERGGPSEIRMYEFAENVIKTRQKLLINMETGFANYGGVNVAINKRTEDQVQAGTVCLYGAKSPFAAYSTMALYGASFWDGSTQRREFVPALSLKTGSRGLYDYVTGAFCTNTIENAADFTGEVSGGLYVDGDPSRIGSPTIPYGWSDLADGLDFEISESNTVVVAGERLHVRAIARYSYDATAGKWAFAGRTRGPKVSGTSSATPTKYVLEWRPSSGLVLMVR